MTLYLDIEKIETVTDTFQSITDHFGVHVPFGYYTLGFLETGNIATS